MSRVTGFALLSASVELLCCPRCKIRTTVFVVTCVHGTHVCWEIKCEGGERQTMRFRIEAKGEVVVYGRFVSFVAFCCCNDACIGDLLF